MATIEQSGGTVERKELFKIPKEFWKFDIVKLQEKHFDAPVPLSNEEQDSQDEDESNKAEAVASAFDPEAPLELSCRTCGIKFGTSKIPENVSSQHSHFKSTWHSTNVSRKSQSLPALSERQFNSINPNSTKIRDSKDDQSNIRAGNPNKIILYTSNHLKISFFRCILPEIDPNPKTNLRSSQSSQLLSQISLFSTSKNTWAFFMNSGGNFAFAIFDHTGTPTIHKTIKRYTVRRKQGGSQSSHDQKGSAAKSAGAFHASLSRSETETRNQRDIGTVQG